jgi:hypothetical protein
MQILLSWNVIYEFINKADDFYLGGTQFISRLEHQQS